VDMESLCVVAGKYVWSVRIDLHILDNGGYVLSHLLCNNVINVRLLLQFQTSLLPFFVPQKSH
jgi:exosome complex RNA-binding protein Rrp42 (RNase PH superfamily)